MDSSGLPKLNQHPPRTAASRRMSASLPGPVYFPGLMTRNPITGRGVTYSNYPWAKQEKFTTANIKEHERSIFTDTSYNSSFFIIHPDWTSEANSIRRMVAKEKANTGSDARPAIQPLRENFLPMLKKNAHRSGATVPDYYNSLVNDVQQDRALALMRSYTMG